MDYNSVHALFFLKRKTIISSNHRTYQIHQHLFLLDRERCPTSKEHFRFRCQFYHFPFGKELSECNAEAVT